MHGRTAFPVLLSLMLIVAGCGGSRLQDDGWNSYYYGGYQKVDNKHFVYTGVGGDNDSNYVPPVSGSIDPVMPASSASSIRMR